TCPRYTAAAPATCEAGSQWTARSPTPSQSTPRVRQRGRAERPETPIKNSELPPTSERFTGTTHKTGDNDGNCKKMVRSITSWLRGNGPQRAADEHSARGAAGRCHREYGRSGIGG